MTLNFLRTFPIAFDKIFLPPYVPLIVDDFILEQ